MITKKMLALSCLFLAVPVCAMKRRVGRRALARKSSAIPTTQTRSLSIARGKYRNRTYMTGKKKRSLVNSLTYRLFCTDERKKTDEEVWAKVAAIEKSQNNALMVGASGYLTGLVSVPFWLYSSETQIIADVVQYSGPIASAVAIATIVGATVKNLECREKMERLKEEYSDVFKRKEKEAEALRQKRVKEELEKWKPEVLAKEIIWTEREIERLTGSSSNWIYGSAGFGAGSLLRGNDFGLLLAGAGLLIGSSKLQQEEHLKKHMKDKLDFIKYHNWRLYDDAMKEVKRIKEEERVTYLNDTFLAKISAEEGMRRYKNLYNIKD